MLVILPLLKFYVTISVTVFTNDFPVVTASDACLPWDRY